MVRPMRINRIQQEQEVVEEQEEEEEEEDSDGGFRLRAGWQSIRLLPWRVYR